jgi:oxygen-independent coproporphyrinogen-3 oxidase
MARAAKGGTLRRNFQGYTDDTSPVLVGLGASSISRFPQGFAQNASGTANHTREIRVGKFSTHRGHAFGGQDVMRARIIEALMCDFHVSRDEILSRFAILPTELDAMFRQAADSFDGMVTVTDKGLSIRPEGRPLTRMIARAFDAYDQTKAQHSAAV